MDITVILWILLITLVSNPSVRLLRNLDLGAVLFEVARAKLGIFHLDDLIIAPLLRAVNLNFHCLWNFMPHFLSTL